MNTSTMSSRAISSESLWQRYHTKEFPLLCTSVGQNFLSISVHLHQMTFKHGCTCEDGCWIWNNSVVPENAPAGTMIAKDILVCQTHAQPTATLLSGHLHLYCPGAWFPQARPAHACKAGC